MISLSCRAIDCLRGRAANCVGSSSWRRLDVGRAWSGHPITIPSECVFSHFRKRCGTSDQPSVCILTRHLGDAREAALFKPSYPSRLSRMVWCVGDTWREPCWEPNSRRFSRAGPQPVQCFHCRQGCPQNLPCPGINVCRSLLLTAFLIRKRLPSHIEHVSGRVAQGEQNRWPRVLWRGLPRPIAECVSLRRG